MPIEESKEKIVEYDVGKEDDLFWATSNLISTEEHLEHTYVRTNKKVYLDILNEIRQIRSKHLQTLIKNTEGDSWCCGKHLLSSFMRLTEMATKELYDKNIEKSKEYFEYAFALHDLFFSIQMIPELEKLKKEGDKNQKPL